MSTLRHSKSPGRSVFRCTSRDSSVQFGFSIIEALIALAVLSMGLAGVAAMDLNSLRYAHSSYNRSLASTIALDFEERLWLAVASNDLTGCPDTSSGEGSLSSTLIADWSRYQPDEGWAWSAMPFVQLPNLQISMGTPVAGNLTTEIPITLSWSEDRFTANETAGEQFTYTVRVVCRPEAS